jgi:uncharacterized protein YeaO (DUF488 family)
MAVEVGRVYDSTQGARVLVDRLWPRGLSRDKADLAWWCREVGPSTELRRWYGHVPERFAEFARRYRAELRTGEQATALAELREMAAQQPVVLVTATRDVGLSGARVLADVLAERA